MAPKVYNAWCNEQHERDLLDGYGQCCKTPCILAVYSIDKSKDGGDCKFIRYECAICGRLLFMTAKISRLVGQWI